MSGGERFREVNETKTDRSDQAALDASFLLEPEARHVLNSMRFNNFESALSALEELFGNLEIVGEEITFDAAGRTLDTALDAFNVIDQDHDSILSQAELANYADHEVEELRYQFQWLSLNVDALSRASLVPHPEHGLSHSDLIGAREIFSGLAYLQKNFEQIGKDHGDGNKEITSDDLGDYVQKQRKLLAPADVSALSHLAVYLQRLKSGDAHPGLRRLDLEHLTPEKIWGDKMRQGHI
jgi:hypothetical protein